MYLWSSVYFHFVFSLLLILNTKYFFGRSLVNCLLLLFQFFLFKIKIIFLFLFSFLNAYLLYEKNRIRRILLLIILNGRILKCRLLKNWIKFQQTDLHKSKTVEARICLEVETQNFEKLNSEPLPIEKKNISN